jgi:NAD(P)H dehydrogenase (quinone)
VSDLHAMKWQPVVTSDDYGHDPAERLAVGPESARAYEEGRLSPDIVEEQEKLRWADALVLQFPLWWYGMPAILKGWFDRVFLKGFAYGIPDPDWPGQTVRYGDGMLGGKRAMVVVTAGGREASLGPRGVNGYLDELLFPLQHGTLWYTGMTVLPPLAVYGANRVDEDEFRAAAGRLTERLLAMEQTEPLPFRRQNSGDYDDDLVLRPDRAPGRAGLAVHYRDRPDDPGARRS